LVVLLLASERDVVIRKLIIPLLFNRRWRRSSLLGSLLDRLGCFRFNRHSVTDVPLLAGVEAVQEGSLFKPQLLKIAIALILGLRYREGFILLGEAQELKGGVERSLLADYVLTVIEA